MRARAVEIRDPAGTRRRVGRRIARRKFVYERTIVRFGQPAIPFRHVCVVQRRIDRLRVRAPVARRAAARRLQIDERRRAPVADERRHTGTAPRQKDGAHAGPHPNTHDSPRETVDSASIVRDRAARYWPRFIELYFFDFVR
ncbi:hypothetical protein BCEP4_680002 [Burkholderia cepacia]|nr:hypothetical protein BCEP4_680002 [Burkholderia cepacia]